MLVDAPELIERFLTQEQVGGGGGGAGTPQGRGC